MRWQQVCGGLILVLAAGRLWADVDTAPYLFESPAIDATGSFEWDEFTGTYAGPHQPDALAFGTGQAQLAADGAFLPEAGGPPFGVLTSTQNLYTGATLGEWTIELSELPTDHPSTTIVLQVASLEPLDTSTFRLGDEPPMELLDRGPLAGVLHDTDGQQAEFDTFRYWAEWQIEAGTEADLAFSAAGPHTSLAGARLDYFHLGSLYDAPAPGAAIVPGPGDADGDGDVDSVDMNTLILAWTGSLDPGLGGRTLADGDFDGDQDVDSADMTTVILHWTGASAQAALVQVPEPASGTAGLLALVVGGLLARRRRPSGRGPSGPPAPQVLG